MKNVLLGMLFLLGVLCFYVSCDNNEPKEPKYVEQTVGVLVDATVVATSFNESVKTQVKTSERFFIVFGLPQFVIGDSILVKVKDNAVIEVEDCRGEWFKVR